MKLSVVWLPSSRFTPLYEAPFTVEVNSWPSEARVVLMVAISALGDRIVDRANNARDRLQTLGDRPIGGVVGSIGDFQAGRNLVLRRRQILLRHIERLQRRESRSVCEK